MTSVDMNQRRVIFNKYIATIQLETNNPQSFYFTIFFQVPETPIWLLSKGRQKDALESLCRLRGWAQPEDVKQEFDELKEYYEELRQCVLCAKQGKTVEPCEHYNTSTLKETLLKIKNIFFVKETMKPFLLVLAYFFFHTTSGAMPVRPNMVNVCKALGMKYNPKSIVVSIQQTKQTLKTTLLLAFNVLQSL